MRRVAAAEFMALCDVAAMALARAETAGALHDDRPELCLAALRRWCAGDATLDEVDAAAQEATDAWSQGFTTPAAPAFGAIDWLCLGAQDALGAVDDELRAHVLANARDTLAALGEDVDAAAQQVQDTFRAAFAARRAETVTTARAR